MVFVMEVVVVVVFYCGDGLFTVCLVLVVGGDVDDNPSVTKMITLS